jgi:hypothetical protein
MENLLDTAEFYRQMIEYYEPCTLVIADKLRFLYVHDQLGLNMRVGELLTPGSGTHTALIQNKPIVKMIDAESSVYTKKAYLAVCKPIHDDSGVAIGVVSWGISTNRVKLSSMSEELSSISQALHASSGEFTDHSRQLLEANRMLTGLTAKLKEQMNLIETMSSVVSNISSQSQLLGLNASIEAAHAGEHGRGFSVLAQEIRKLAVESNQSISEIREQVEAVNDQMQILSRQTGNLGRISEEQAVGAEQLTTGLDRVNKLAARLRELANESSKFRNG